MTRVEQSDARIVAVREQHKARAISVALSAIRWYNTNDFGTKGALEAFRVAMASFEQFEAR